MSESDAIRVLLVDDHRMIRDGLRAFLSISDSIEVVGEAGDGEEAVRVSREVHPHVALVDLVMPGMDGATAITRIKSEMPEVQCIALTSFIEEDLVRRAIEAGAIGYLLKDTDPSRLTMAITDAYQGRSTIVAAAAQVLVRVGRHEMSLGDDLTKRERAVLATLADGMSNKQIAKELRVSQATVRLHVSNILAKLGADNRTEAVSLALRHNLLK
jgi:NarL family two-component system response regulator LiaR